MNRKPIDDFILVRDRIEELGQRLSLEDVFKDLSESLAIVENDILTDNISDNFGTDLSELVLNYLTILSLKYNIDDLYSFLESRSHWGVYNDDYFMNVRQSLVEPYYSARVQISSLILHKDRGMSVKPLFDLTAYLIHLEENI